MISQHLKNETAELHSAAEKLFNSSKIFNKTYTIDDYQKIISANYQMLLKSEATIFSLLDFDFGDKMQLGKRKKLHLIEKDILENSLPIKNDSQTINISTVHQALGALYVIEGSTLGGNVMAKQLSKTIGFENCSFYYFRCYNDETGIMWNAFKNILDDTVKETNYAEVLSGATKLYQSLLNYK